VDPRFVLVGVPTSAGAHGPGHEKAPVALRRAGLVEALRTAGLDLEDDGDLPVTRFQPDPGHRKQQSVGRVTAIATQVAARMEGRWFTTVQRLPHARRSKNCSDTQVVSCSTSTSTLSTQPTCRWLTFRTSMPAFHVTMP